MRDKLVSVIVPTYNGEKRIAATLEAIINQDHGNLEIIVVDDVSTDNTANIAKEILNSSSRTFQFIKRSENGGQCAARNTGLKHANGDYVIFFDHDDLAEKNFVSGLLREIEDKNADLVFCGIKHYYESKDKFEAEPVTLKEKFLDPEYYLKAWAKREMKFWSVWNFIFRKSFVDAIKLSFNEHCKLGEDTEFVLKAIAMAKKVSFVNDMLYIYVHNSGMTSLRYAKDRKIFESLALSRYRSIRPVIRKVKDKTIRNYAVNFYVADSIVTLLTNCAKFKAIDDYQRMTRILRHKKIRELLFSTVKFIFHKPELFLKAFMLLHMPKLYYSLRKKKTARI